MERRWWAWWIVLLWSAATQTRAAETYERPVRSKAVQASARRVVAPPEAPAEETETAATDGESLVEEEGLAESGGCAACGEGNCDTCWTDCEPARELFGGAEYLLWWVQGARTPPLVTTSPNGTPANQAGVLPDATILFGNERIDDDLRSGGRFTLGYWLDDCECWGVESRTFVLENSGTEFGATSDEFPILARPFNDVTNGFPGTLASALVAFPNQIEGAINVRTTNRVMGTEVNLRKALWEDCCRRLEVLAGYRFFRMNDGLRIDESTLDDDGVQIDATDNFNTENRFHGGQIGAIYSTRHRQWTLEVVGKLGFGGMAQIVDINGSTTLTAPGVGPTTDTGGILALDSNIGSFHRTEFSLVPELNIQLRRQVAKHAEFVAGYTFLFVSDVVRPGDQIDLNIDTDLFPPAQGNGTSPSFGFVGTDVWVQGLSLGFECRF